MRNSVSLFLNIIFLYQLLLRIKLLKFIVHYFCFYTDIFIPDSNKLNMCNCALNLSTENKNKPFCECNVPSKVSIQLYGFENRDKRI